MSSEVYASRYTRCDPFTASRPLLGEQQERGDDASGRAAVNEQAAAAAAAPAACMRPVALLDGCRRAPVAPDSDVPLIREAQPDNVKHHVCVSFAAPCKLSWRSRQLGMGGWGGQSFE